MRVKNIITALLKGPVLFYRYIISPLLPPRCRFYPSCSVYCLQALEKHGPFAGLWLATKRVCACHPWSGRHGYDPVPEPDNQQPTIKLNKNEKTDTSHAA